MPYQWLNPLSHEEGSCSGSHSRTLLYLNCTLCLGRCYERKLQLVIPGHHITDIDLFPSRYYYVIDSTVLNHEGRVPGQSFLDQIFDHLWDPFICSKKSNNVATFRH
jgi:hypothetical protein